MPPPALTPRQAAQLAGNLGIPVYAIGAGPEFADTPKEVAGAAAEARKVLEEIARITSGRAFQAGDGKALGEVCNQIDQLERSRVLSFQYRRYYEGHTGFAVAALMSWLLLIGLENTCWRRLP